MAPDVTSYSLPKSQTPTFLPANCCGEVMLLSFQLTESVPDRWKICAMLTRSDWPVSTAWSAFGTHASVNSGPFGADPTVTFATFGPPASKVTLSPSSA